MTGALRSEDILLQNYYAMDESKKKWFKSLPKWLKIFVAILVAAVCTIYALTSCGNTKVLLRNAHSATISQQGSDIEVTVSASVDSASVKWNKSRK